MRQGFERVQKCVLKSPPNDSTAIPFSTSLTHLLQSIIVVEQMQCLAEQFMMPSCSYFLSERYSHYYLCDLCVGRECTTKQLSHLHCAVVVRFCPFLRAADNKIPRHKMNSIVIVVVVDGRGCANVVLLFAAGIAQIAAV